MAAVKPSLGALQGARHDKGLQGTSGIQDYKPGGTGDPVAGGLFRENEAPVTPFSCPLNEFDVGYGTVNVARSQAVLQPGCIHAGKRSVPRKAAARFWSQGATEGDTLQLRGLAEGMAGQEGRTAGSIPRGSHRQRKAIHQPVHSSFGLRRLVEIGLLPDNTSQEGKASEVPRAAAAGPQRCLPDPEGMSNHVDSDGRKHKRKGLGKRTTKDGLEKADVGG